MTKFLLTKYLYSSPPSSTNTNTSIFFLVNTNTNMNTDTDMYSKADTNTHLCDYILNLNNFFVTRLKINRNFTQLLHYFEKIKAA